MSTKNAVRTYRALTEDEIGRLVSQGCEADNWADILVDEEFTPEGIRHSSFSGPVRLGRNCFVRQARCFSHGKEICVLTETGTRPVMVHPGLSPVSVYVQALHAYRDDGMLERLRHILEPYACACVIDDGAHIDSATLRNCYVGPGVIIEDGFAAEECIFLSGSHLAKGEACAIVAGPFTVSHHKATLLIAAMMSFFNAGSGSNQSNHSYKLGPNKFGILERGAKLGSSSYLFWPARVGAFSTVLGHHMTHFDLHDLPFSYIIGEEGRTVVIPAVALQSIGTFRDAQKWQQRGMMLNTPCPITFAALNPYTAGRIRAAVQLLERLKTDEPAVITTATGIRHKYYRLGDCLIPTRSVDKALSLYREALCRYGFGTLCSRLVHEQPLSTTGEAQGEWLDYLGTVLPKTETYEAFTHALDQPQPVADLIATTQRYPQVLAQWEWNWVSQMLREDFGFDPIEASSEQYETAIGQYKLAVRNHQLLLHFDIDKEFNQEARLLYGIDGTPEDAKRDFEKSMGKEEENDTFRKLLQQTDEALLFADKALKRRRGA